MRAPGLAVDRTHAEKVRRRLSEGGWLRGDLRPTREEGRVVFPLTGPPESLPLDVPGVRGEFDFAASASPRPQDYRELLQLPPEKQGLLPTSFDVVGDVVLIRLPPELRPHGEEIGKALLAFVPGCRRVGLDLGVHGVSRLRTLTPLAGEGDWATLHRENGISLEVDVEKAYFSPRLAREHARVADLARPGERVLDLFCGVGPFALTILRRQPASTAVAVDLNPEAIRLLRSNARRLGVDDRIEVIEAPAEEFLRRPDRFDRVVMNLPREGYKYATSVARHVMPGGTLHHYEVVERDAAPGRAAALLHDLEEGMPAPWSLDPPRVVHAYSPSADLLAWTAHRGA